MEIKPFFDGRTFTMTYVVYDPQTRDAVIIDPVLDYDPAASKTWTESIDAVVAFVSQEGLTVHYLLETHAHADHLSGSQILKERYRGARVAIGARITEVQRVFKEVFDLPPDFPVDGSQFDQLLHEGQTYHAGSLSFDVLFTPGHTPADAAYLFGDAVFTGDTLFMPDYGTGRCDFPAGSAGQLYDSVVQKLYQLPPETRVFVGHDYQPGGRPVAWQSTIGEERRDNVHVRDGVGRDEFIRFRTSRDATLSAPKLLFQSVQVNVDAGRLPDARPNQIRYLRIPINVFRPRPSGDVDLGPV